MVTFKKIKTICSVARYYMFDLINDIKYRNLFKDNDCDKEKLLAILSVSCHTIEKGLTLPYRKESFGQVKSLHIITLCNKYINAKFDVNDPLFIDCLQVLKEYIDLQVKNGVANNNAVEPAITLLKRFPKLENRSQLYNIKREQYFEMGNCSFDVFSSSRRSCRSLSGHVDNERLSKALDLAMNAPSTCNRQSIRIHLIASEDAKRKILTIQNGCKGFGEYADKFILLTSEMADWENVNMRNAPYVDGGIFTMNLLYCLHFYKIGACTLNLYLSPKNTRILHKTLSISDNELPITLIAIGMPPAEFCLTRSRRRNMNEITTNH